MFSAIRDDIEIQLQSFLCATFPEGKNNEKSNNDIINGHGFIYVQSG